MDVPVIWLRPAPPPAPADSLAQWEPAGILDRLGLTAADVAFTMVWAGDVPSPTATRSRVSLLAASVRLVDGNGGELGRYPLADGVAVVPLPVELGSVETLAADGSLIEAAGPMGSADLGNG